MLKIIAIIAVIVGIAVVVLLVLAMRKPDNFRVERRLDINAPPEKIFPLIEDLRKWAAWSPYEVKDPAMTRTFSGNPRGVGAVYAWDGNKNVGSGRMEITDTTLPSRIVIKLDFFKPFEGHNTAEFTLPPHNGTTMVT
ncbi:K(+)-transporting ATPase subunit F [soil metagenome]